MELVSKYNAKIGMKVLLHHRTGRYKDRKYDVISYGYIRNLGSIQNTIDPTIAVRWYSADNIELFDSQYSARIDGGTGGYPAEISIYPDYSIETIVHNLEILENKLK